VTDQALPHKIATLCILRNSDGQVLLLRRAREPNRGLYSPIGGKLDTHLGESPAQCAQREIREEAELKIPLQRLRLNGIVSETGFEDSAHWLMFIYRVVGIVETAPRQIDEGELIWCSFDSLADLPMPETDRKVIWPLICTSAGRFFAAHIDCRNGSLRWTVEQHP
jgi:8-oxo-dGTP diphosphatase